MAVPSPSEPSVHSSLPEVPKTVGPEQGNSRGGDEMKWGSWVHLGGKISLGAWRLSELKMWSKPLG